MSFYVLTKKKKLNLLLYYYYVYLKHRYVLLVLFLSIDKNTCTTRSFDYCEIFFKIFLI